MDNRSSHSLGHTIHQARRGLARPVVAATRSQVCLYPSTPIPRDVIWDANICTCALEKKGVNFGTCSADGTAKIWNINETTDQVSPLCCYTGHSGRSISSESPPRVREFHRVPPHPAARRHRLWRLDVSVSALFELSSCQVWKPSIRASDDSEATFVPLLPPHALERTSRTPAPSPCSPRHPSAAPAG